MTSQLPVRSSSVTKAIADPPLVVVRLTAVIRPPTVTGVLSGNSSNWLSATLIRAASVAWTCRSGWSEMYKPSISFSIANSSSRENSSTGPAGAAASAGAVSPLRSNNPVCPDARARCTRWAASIASSSSCSNWARGIPRESSAPALIKLSSTRRFTARGSTRSTTSVSEVNAPVSWRACRIASTDPRPTFFTAARPNRMASPATVKSSNDSFTSGGSTRMPMRTDSATAAATLSVSPASLLSTAAMYSAG